LSETTGNPPENPRGLRSSAAKVWRIFTSLKLAIVLILVVVGLTLIGTFVIQVPADYSADPRNYLWWLENIAQPQTGAWYPLLKFWGFFDLFHSFWFIVTGLLLVVNILVCSLNRINQVKSRLSLKPVIHDRAFFTDSPGSDAASNIKSIDHLVSFLKKRRYQVAVNDQQGEFHVLAIKNRFSPLGVYLVHFSLILFILGFLISHYRGFEISSLVVAEGQTRNVGYATGLAIKLENFQYKSYPDGSPESFRSEIILLKDQNPVISGEVEVNHPLKYQGVRFYQSFYGPAENLRISYNGTEIYNGFVALDSTMNNHPYLRPAGLINLAEQGYVIYLVAPSINISDPVLKSDQLGIEVYRNNNREAVSATVLNLNTPLSAGDLAITFTGTGYYSGFLVNSDPGVGFIWTGSAFLLVGLIAVFYFPRRQLQAALLANPETSHDLFWRWDNPGVNSNDTRRLMDFLKNKSIDEYPGRTNKET
jgi:cytochrome c biogenesis protein